MTVSFLPFICAFWSIHSGPSHSFFSSFHFLSFPHQPMILFLFQFYLSCREWGSICFLLLSSSPPLSEIPVSSSRRFWWLQQSRVGFWCFSWSWDQHHHHRHQNHRQNHQNWSFFLQFSSRFSILLPTSHNSCRISLPLFLSTADVLVSSSSPPLLNHIHPDTS